MESLFPFASEGTAWLEPVEYVFPPLKESVDMLTVVSAPAVTDRDLIPDIGMKELKSGQTAETHRFAIHFGEKTFEWVKVDTLLDFASNAERLKREQKCMLSRSKYRSALDIAFERLGKHNTKVDSPRGKKYEIDIAENKLKERLGNLRDTPPTTFKIS